ncbi:MAG: hypothetical protein LBP58_05715 [Azoarcus sp.]|nr:hypothetical protein [Azoarcus sp.]
MGISRKSPHPMIEPLDYELMPESAAKHFSGDTLALYELVWKGALATMVEGPTFVRTIIDIVVGPQSNETDKADLHLRINGLERATADPEDHSWAVLLPGEALPRARCEGLTGDALPAALRERIDELGAGHLDAQGWRAHDGAQCRRLETLLSPTGQWRSVPVRQDDRYGFDRLIEDMAHRGVGRPSTYAETVDAARKNGLIRLVDGSLEVTRQGRALLDKLPDPDTGKAQGFARLDAAFSSDLALALDVIEADPATAGQVLSAFSRRAIRFEATALAAWLDSLEIEGETLTEAIARAERILPSAASWTGVDLPPGLVPTLLCERPETLIELRRRLDEVLAGTDVPVWKALTGRQRAARRLRALLPDTTDCTVANWAARAARDLVLRWWIDLSPAERPLAPAEVMQGQASGDAPRDLMEQVIALLAPARGNGP